jgi:hypothetical protein
VRSEVSVLGGGIGQSRKQDRAQERRREPAAGTGAGTDAEVAPNAKLPAGAGAEKGHTHNENKSTLEESKCALLLGHCVGEESILW